ncbi:probable sugar phosphate/phosphate translocator At3g14410 [Camellia sinensis]|uniref:probable sugar phosphate/phosphate translocator At3g14410 n=1 Tax=Camellia sinensis TaxID=4442 RepID=UPI0010367A6F|nr:probable sugar phosphate/phosphate translocator At3g14410 [Camellia sinensis]
MSSSGSIRSTASASSIDTNQTGDENAPLWGYVTKIAKRDEDRSAGLAFHLARNPYFVGAFKFAAENQIIGYVPPRYNLLRTTLLQKEKANIDRLLEPTKQSWNKKGLSVVVDGWTNAQRRPLINLMAASDGGAMFVRAVNCKGEYKDKYHIAKLISELIDEVSPHNVIQVITDNTPVCSAAGSIIQECSRMLLIMSVIRFSVLMTTYEEIDINWIGLVYQMGGVVGEALRLIFMEIFVKMKGLKLNPIFVMYYVSPCSVLCLFILWIFLEKPKMDAQGTWSFQPVILTLNSLYTFALNLSVFLVISHTSALTIRVAGVVKDWVVVLLSALLFVDTMLTMINLFGYGIAIAGVVAYNNHKLKKEASQGSFDESQHAESTPLTSSSTIESR